MPAIYNVKIPIVCASNDEAVRVQRAISELVSDMRVEGGQLVGFYELYRRNETIIRPALSDIMRNGVIAVARHIPKLLKIK